MKKEPAGRKNRAEWQQTIAAWKKSGLSPGDFCEKRGLKPRTFGWWRWKLDGGRKPGEELAFVEVSVKPTKAHPRKTVTPRRMEELEVRIGEAVAVRVPKGFDRATLVEVVSALLGSKAC